MRAPPARERAPGRWRRAPFQLPLPTRCGARAGLPCQHHGSSATLPARLLDACRACKRGPACGAPLHEQLLCAVARCPGLGQSRRALLAFRLGVPAVAIFTGCAHPCAMRRGPGQSWHLCEPIQQGAYWPQALMSRWLGFACSPLHLLDRYRRLGLPFGPLGRTVGLLPPVLHTHPSPQCHASAKGFYKGEKQRRPYKLTCCVCMCGPCRFAGSQAMHHASNTAHARRLKDCNAQNRDTGSFIGSAGRCWRCGARRALSRQCLGRCGRGPFLGRAKAGAI